MNKRHPLRPPLPPQPTAPSLGSQLGNGLNATGALLGVAFYGALAALGFWFAAQLLKAAHWF